VRLLNCDRETAVVYGIIKSQLKKDGKPIPENDVWIAAIAMQHDLRLLTNDKHFDYVKTLKIEKL
jgi:tRNA(fMet)-specific endonuclease VapC